MESVLTICTRATTSAFINQFEVATIVDLARGHGKK